MIELKFAEYPAIIAFFDTKKQHIPALSVLLGNYPGRVFADRESAPTMAVVWATGRWMYAAGDIGPEENRLKLTAFLQSVVIPDCRQRNEKWFEIYTDELDTWTELFMSGLDGLKVYRHLESVYEFGRQRFEQLEEQAVANTGSGVDSIEDQVTVEIKEMPIIEDKDDSSSDLHKRFSGLTTTGAAVRAGNRTVSVCKNNGFCVNNSYFIDVDTYVEVERGKGYATLAAQSLIRHYLKQGMHPLWETTHENAASHKLALKLGFEPVESYPVFAFVIE